MFDEFLEIFAKVKLLEYVSKEKKLPVKVVGIALPERLVGVVRLIRIQFPTYTPVMNVFVNENPAVRESEHVQFLVEFID